MLIGEVWGRGRKPFQHHGKCPTWLRPTGDASHDPGFAVFRITQRTHLLDVSLPQ